MNALFATGVLVLCTGLLFLLVNRAVWWGLKQGNTPTYCVTFATLILLVAYVLTLVTARVLFQLDLLGIWRQEFEASLKQTIDLYIEFGLDQKEVAQAAQVIRLLFLEGALGWAVVMTTGVSLLTYLLQRRWLSHLLGSKVPLPTFSRWRASEKLVWLLMTAMVATLLGSRGFSWAGWVGLNGLIITGSFYFVYGLAVTKFYMEKRSVSRFWQVTGVALLLIFPTLILVVTIIGVVDTWWDWRRLRATSLRNE